MNKGSILSVLTKEEPNRIPYDDMGEFNGKNIEDESTANVVATEIDGLVWDAISSMVK